MGHKHADAKNDAHCRNDFGHAFTPKLWLEMP
jgi:hypothetical protein